MSKMTEAKPSTTPSPLSMTIAEMTDVLRANMLQSMIERMNNPQSHENGAIEGLRRELEAIRKENEQLRRDLHEDRISKAISDLKATQKPSSDSFENGLRLLEVFLQGQQTGAKNTNDNAQLEAMRGSLELVKAMYDNLSRKSDKVVDALAPYIEGKAKRNLIREDKELGIEPPAIPRHPLQEQRLKEMERGLEQAKEEIPEPETGFRVIGGKFKENDD
jgi:hypothetical protein